MQGVWNSLYNAHVLDRCAQRHDVYTSVCVHNSVFDSIGADHVYCLTFKREVEGLSRYIYLY